jgi:hypothetical protein
LDVYYKDLPMSSDNVVTKGCCYMIRTDRCVKIRLYTAQLLAVILQ